MVRSRHVARLAAAVLGVAAWGACADEVTIYRCTDAAGRLSLRDTPCKKGETQQARNMIRPKDAPSIPAPRARDERKGEDRRDAATNYVMVTPPRPMYECVSDDGERYISETGEGRRRFEPAYVPTYPLVAYPRDAYHGVYGRVDYRGNRVNGTVRIGEPPRPRPHPHIVPVIAAGEWVQDPCYALPQADVCDRLRDERYELNRRWNIAQPSERAQIDRQTRSLDARLDNDCGGR